MRFLRFVGIAIGALTALAIVGFRYSATGAEGVSANCRYLVADGQTACYRQLLGDLLAARGLASAVAALDALVATDPEVFRRAHEFAHGLGIEAYSRHPDIVSSFAACGDGSSSGCRHGFMQAYFESLDRVSAPDIEALCLPFKGADATRWILFQCVHGMGHGLTMFHEHDLPKALADCDRLSDGWDRESCYGGAIMESDMRAIAPHHPASELAARSHHAHAGFRTIDPGDLLYPCSILADRHLRACYELQTSVMLHLNGGDIADAARACDRAPAAMRDTCYRSLGRDISGRAQRDPHQSARSCAKGSAAHQPACYVGVAKALVDWNATTDDALEFCRLVARAGRAGSDACHEAIGEQIATLSNEIERRSAECARASTSDGVAACRRGARLP